MARLIDIVMREPGFHFELKLNGSAGATTYSSLSLSHTDY